MNTIFQDIRYGVRMLIKTPALTFVVILALALGIGANTAIFSVINAVVLRPLPYDHAEQLLFLNERSPVLDEMSISYPNFTDWRNQNHVFEKIGVYNRNSYNFTGYGEAERIPTAQVSADLFSALRRTMFSRVASRCGCRWVNCPAIQIGSSAAIIRACTRSRASSLAPRRRKPRPT